MNLQDVVIVSAVRLPIGRFGGSLKDLKVYNLGGYAISAAVKKAGIAPGQVDEVIMSHTRQDGTGPNPARSAALLAGIPVEVPAHTVNKVCAAGVKAMALATQAIRIGDAEVIVCGGMESMSNIPHLLRGARWKGFRLTNIVLEDGFLYLSDPICGLTPGLCAERCAEKWSISREDQERVGYESHIKAARAWEEGIFNNEVVPVEIPASKEQPAYTFIKDECYRSDVTLEKMMKLPPAFKEGGTVSAGSSSGITDGAGAMVVMSRQKANELGVKPLASIVAYSFYGVPPEDFPEGPMKVIPIVLEKAGLGIDDITYFEINEAFGVVVVLTQRMLGIPSEKINPHGGGISLGHPTGFSGARLLIHLANILKPGEYGLATLCGAGGLAGAIIIKGE
ncbi:thiolase family protein [Desulfallas sp. Bu1-1]|uniref:thiolase family protein n=1 Tax=Desulfallas sp. Bu1-1 TaxID=2787620 RepID=UPI0018A11806|nr:thiolase family protein [Desulfallas sp. Bu1-1]MBF7083005.1 thiolase family protein [Desulfallas sp. Bu1-1]